MENFVIHQFVHGYREGHRLLQASTSIDSEVNRILLVMSDMSGPSMEPGFEQYVTAYPLPNGKQYVLAKTWYASEMRRPGCVWTHSLLLDNSALRGISSRQFITRLFSRPTMESVASGPSLEPLTSCKPWTGTNDDDFLTDEESAVDCIIKSIYSESSSPVLILGDNAEQFEGLLFALWLQQWPNLRSRFGFCSGALSPRAVLEKTIDVQVVPRTTSLSLQRRLSSGAAVIDPRRIGTSHERSDWVAVLRRDLTDHSPMSFRYWVDSWITSESSRNLMPSVATIFGDWTDTASTDPIHLLRTISRSLSPETIRSKSLSKLLDQVFSRYQSQTDSDGVTPILRALASIDELALFSFCIPEIEEEISRLYDAGKSQVLDLLTDLLKADLEPLGEEIVTRILAHVDVQDALQIVNTHPELTATLVKANRLLACSPWLWSGVGPRKRELLSELVEDMRQDKDYARQLVASILTSPAEDVADILCSDLGGVAVPLILDAIREKRMECTWIWRQALQGQQVPILEWVEKQSSIDDSAMMVAARVLDPRDKLTAKRTSPVWKTYLATVGENRPHNPRIAAFGLALGLALPTFSNLLSGFFQDVFDALWDDAHEFEVWAWVERYAPVRHRWKDWDKCERITAAVSTRLLQAQSPDTEFFATIRSLNALEHAANVISHERTGKAYLKSLRSALRNTASDNLSDERQAILRRYL